MEEKPIHPLEDLLLYTAEKLQEQYKGHDCFDVFTQKLAAARGAATSEEQTDDESQHERPHGEKAKKK